MPQSGDGVDAGRTEGGHARGDERDEKQDRRNHRERHRIGGLHSE